VCIQCNEPHQQTYFFIPLHTAVLQRAAGSESFSWVIGSFGVPLTSFRYKEMRNIQNNGIITFAD